MLSDILLEYLMAEKCLSAQWESSVEKRPELSETEKTKTLLRAETSNGV